MLEPENLFAELDQLRERGIDTTGRLFVSDRAHLVLPYHKLLDAASEKSQKLGTTGRGIGPAYEDKYGRRGIRVTDLRRVECASHLLTDRVGRANRLLEMMGSGSGPSLEDQSTLLQRLAPRLLPIAADTGLLVHRAIREGRRVLLEGAQGALLDVDHGTYPYVTSSNTTAGGAAVGAGIGPTAIDGVLGVVKAYTTRVGNGPLPTEAESSARRASASTRRRVWRGDWAALADAAGSMPRWCAMRRVSTVLTGLAVTKLDVLDSFAEIPVGIAYRLDGKSCEEMPGEVDALGRVEPMYEVHQGWQRPTCGRPPPGRPSGGRPRVPGSAGGALRSAGAVCERWHPPRSDNRSMKT